MSASEFSTKISFLSLALRAGGGTLLLMQVVSGDARLSGYPWRMLLIFYLQD